MHSEIKPQKEMNERYSEKDAMQRYMKMLGQSRPFFLNADYNLEQFTKDLQTNRAYASRFVNNTLGTTFPKLLQSLRLAHAERLMHTFPEMKLSEIWQSSGFNNAVSFRRIFFNKHGQTPSESRKGK